ncbi:MAG: glycosyltransferase family 4 protein [Desulfomicrobium sp.]|nr:glycosyltransferase family 4 protein [Desulfomicrobium sp.]
MHLKPILYYLCLQATRQGQASYSHVHEILSGLQRRGVSAILFEPAHVKSVNHPNIFSRLQGFISTQFKLIFSDKPDLVYVRWHFATILVSFWAKVRNIPVIQEVNGPYEDLFLSYPWTRKFRNFFVFIMRQQLKWADAVIAVTPQLVEWSCKESCHDNVYLISNGANTDIFRNEASHTELIQYSGKYVIFFGALAPWQGVDVMLEAISSHEWPSKVTLLIVGDGADKTKIIEASRSYSCLHYLPSVDQKNLAGLIASSLASMIPKIGEWSKTGLFPLKLFESLACGVPVVVSDWPGMADFVREHQCGIVVPPGDPEALARAVAELDKDPASARIMGGRGSEVVRLSHSWDAKAEETFHIICDVLSNNLKKSPD